MDCGVHICIFLVFQFVYLLIIVWCIVGTTAVLAYNTKGKVTEILLFGYMQVKCVTLKWFDIKTFFFSLMQTWLPLKMCFRTTVVTAKILIPKQ